MELNDVMEFLKASGVTLTPPAQKHLSLGEASSALDVSTKWIREHVGEFPNAWRLPGAGQSGELRIPIRDVDALAARRRLARA